MSRKGDSSDVLDGPRLPVELLHLVAQEIIRIAAGEHGHKELLKTCSLVFSGWRIFFQRALCKIRVPSLQFAQSTDSKVTRKIDELRDLLETNPHFGQAISSLSMIMLLAGTLEFSEPAFTSFLLSHLTNVDTLHISQGNLFGQEIPSWSDLSDESQAALRDLFRSPSLQHLTVISLDAPLAIIFPEGAEIDTVDIRSIRSPELQDDHGPDDFSTPDDSGATKLQLASTAKPCIVRNFKSMAPLAARVLRATQHREGQEDRTPFIDPSAIYSAGIMMTDKGQIRDLRAVLQRTCNLKKLAVFGSRREGGMEGLFRDPHPRCLINIEEIDLTLYWLSDTESLVEAIFHEFSVYPPENVIKRIIVKIPTIMRNFPPPSGKELRNELLALAELFGKTCRFPFLQSVEMIVGSKRKMGKVDCIWDVDLKWLPGILREVMMELQKMTLGFEFIVRMIGL